MVAKRGSGLNGSLPGASVGRPDVCDSSCLTVIGSHDGTSAYLMLISGCHHHGESPGTLDYSYSNRGGAVMVTSLSRFEGDRRHAPLRQLSHVDLHLALIRRRCARHTRAFHALRGALAFRAGDGACHGQLSSARVVCVCTYLEQSSSIASR